MPTRTEENDADLPRVWIAFDEVKLPMNTGALIRSAYFFNGGVIAGSQAGPLPYVSPDAAKAACGALDILTAKKRLFRPQDDDLAAFVKNSRSNGWNVIGTGFGEDAVELAEATQAYSASSGSGTIIVVGSEGRGLRREVSDACQALVMIPGGCPDDVDSLNVSASSAILLHQFSASLKPGSGFRV